jgi:hypothetical protein
MGAGRGGHVGERVAGPAVDVAGLRADDRRPVVAAERPNEGVGAHPSLLVHLDIGHR